MTTHTNRPSNTHFRDGPVIRPYVPEDYVLNWRLILAVWANALAWPLILFTVVAIIIPAITDVVSFLVRML